MSEQRARRPNWKWWLVMAVAILIPPLGILGFAIDWMWRRFLGRPLVNDDVFFN
jgi:hypothetical protein